MDIFRGKEGFMAFCRLFKPFGGFLHGLWVFDGNMVGKWTNEPCNGVDEVVNPFWVLTGTLMYSKKMLMAREPATDDYKSQGTQK